MFSIRDSASKLLSVGGKRLTAAEQIDRAILYYMNRRVPDDFGLNHEDASTLEEVLENTFLDPDQLPSYALVAPGEHLLRLNTPEEEIECRVRVRLAKDPSAPVLIYHHGFSEQPYTNSWMRIFPQSKPFALHTVCVEAPYHRKVNEPLDRGFSDIEGLYQIFAGSLRLLEFVHQSFKAEGAEYSVLCGVSWGGVTNVLYQGIFNDAKAIIPMMSAPNLGQVLSDTAALFGRTLPVGQEVLAELFDFAPYLRRCDPEYVFPLVGEHDMFFQMENHTDDYEGIFVRTVPSSHFFGILRARPLRAHIDDVIRRL